MRKNSTAGREVRITDRAALKQKFESHVSETDTDCRVWVGPKQLRVGDVFLTPRRAAWFLKHGSMPAGEIKQKCMTKDCVYWRHLEEGAARNAGAKAAEERLDEKQIAEIVKKSKGGATIPALADEYKVSVGTIHRHIK